MMTPTLFRAITLDGDTVTRAASLHSPRWSVLTSFLGLSIAAAITFAATADYARKQTTAGALVPDTGTVRIAVPKAGVLTELFVANGASVAPGDPLFIVDHRQSLESGGTLDARVRAALEHQAVLLKKELASEEVRTQAERGGLEAKIAGQSDELNALSSQRQLADTRVRIAQDRATAGSDFFRRGLITESEFRARGYSFGPAAGVGSARPAHRQRKTEPTRGAARTRATARRQRRSRREAARRARRPRAA